MKDKKILITGATGFIGRHLVEDLIDKGYNPKNIYAVVRRTSNINYLVKFHINFIYADISQEQEILSIDKDIDILFHAAAYVSSRNREYLFKVNVDGTKNVCNLARKLNVERFIYLSSVSVVSGNELNPLIEDLDFKHSNFYGESKIEAEKLVLQYRDESRKTVIIRPCMVYGPDEPHMQKLLLWMTKLWCFPLIDQGEKLFHLVYIKNVTFLLIEAMTNDKLLEGTFFVADEKVLTLKEVFNIWAKAINAFKPIVVPKKFTPFLIKLPFIGKKIKFFIKSRSYSIKKIKELGISLPYDAEKALFKSAKECWRRR